MVRIERVSDSVMPETLSCEMPFREVKSLFIGRPNRIASG
jgi:hypothetical protein